MADDDRLLELLGRALAPPPVEPPPERVAAFRALIAQGRPGEADQTDGTAPLDEETDRQGDVRQLPPIVDPRPVAPSLPRAAASRPTTPPRAPTPPAPPPPVVPELARRRARRVGWLAAGASAAAAAVVMAMLAVPSLVADRSRPEASVETARAAVARLRTALATGDPIAVAEADAELVRVAGELPKNEQQQVHNDTVAAHVKAIEFLRENRTPPPPPAPSAGEGAAPTPPVAPGRAQAPPTSVAPVGDPTNPLPPAPDPTPSPPARSVTIIVVSPQVDGTFEVLFGASGFTPEPGRKPGTYAIRFSFDNGQSPTIWTKSEPWRFPGEHAVNYRQVCAYVVDANGVEDPASGSCRNIL